MDTEVEKIESTLPINRKTPSDGILHFRVSTGLKRVLGRELITDDEVALFELVKNSFDAGASNVHLKFEQDTITIADDGSGMSLDDLQQKWLFVAYSSKRDASPSSKKTDYRNEVSEHPKYAGSKGIGRFSSDRLGRFLVLQTRPTNKKGVVHRLDVDWSEFEADDTELLGHVNIKYAAQAGFAFDVNSDDPSQKISHGTVLQISGLTKAWDREAILKLRSGLSKLINPFGENADQFGITILAPRELAADDIAKAKFISKGGGIDESASVVVNGRVGNFIFSTLKNKTTFLDVQIDSNTDTIKTTLSDRGAVIYSISEPNKFSILRGANFHCQLFFLNRAAKSTFSRRMGIDSVAFGSVFLFRNNFRIFPIGETGDDYFGIDRRKQQGYNRYLGTRDIIGKIDVSGPDDMFKEASSRNQGLIENYAVAQLKRCFWDYCFKRLERYVVSVNWHTFGLDGKKDVDCETLSVLETDNGRAHVSAAIANLIGSEEVTVLDYNADLVDVLDERSREFESSLASLRVIAESLDNAELSDRIKRAELRFLELQRAEAEARRIADEERQAKEEANRRATKAEAETQAVKNQLVEERKRSSFLTASAALDVETLNDLHHQITIYSTNIGHELTALLTRLRNQEDIPMEEVASSIEAIALFNQKIHSVTRFATKANFRLDSEFTQADIAEYIGSYISEISSVFVGKNFHLKVNNNCEPTVRRFKPIDISIVIDNLISNARKARAATVQFDIRQYKKGGIEITIADDGAGVAPVAAQEDRLFEKGFTTSTGSGLGLFHVRQTLAQMGGTIQLLSPTHGGATFVVRIPSCD